MICIGAGEVQSIVPFASIGLANSEEHRFRCRATEAGKDEAPASEPGLRGPALATRKWRTCEVGPGDSGKVPSRLQWPAGTPTGIENRPETGRKPAPN